MLGACPADARAHEEVQTLPPLREDLELKRGLDNRDGSASWILHDPAGFRHFNIDWCEFEILSRWSGASSETIIESVNTETTLNIDQGEIGAMEHFLRTNGLLRLPSSEIYQAHATMKLGASNALSSQVSQKLVFRKIPLFRPQKFLDMLVPLTNFIFRIVCALAARAHRNRQDIRSG